MQSKKNRPWHNWSGNVRCEPNHRAHPLSIEEIQSEVLRCTEEGERLRVVGGGHAFSPLCYSDENQMSLRHFHGIESVDEEQRRVWVRAGTNLGKLGELLHARGLALNYSGYLGAQSIAGAISTGAHGSGAHCGTLSTLVTALRLVSAGGHVRTLSEAENPDLLDAARLSLGALGVISHVELQCVDAYRLHCESVQAPLDDTLARLDELLETHRHFEFRWFPYTDTAHLRFMNPTRRSVSAVRPLQQLQQLGLQNGGYWLLSEAARRIPRLHDRMRRVTAGCVETGSSVVDWHRCDAVPPLLRFTRMEYVVPRDRLARVIRQIDRLITALRFPVHFPLEVRFLPRDNLWLSPAYEQDSASIALQVYQGLPYEDFFAAIAEIFDRNEGRPHWGTVHEKTAQDLRELYPRFDDFRALRQELDPRGVFLNGHVAALLDVKAR